VERLTKKGFGLVEFTWGVTGKDEQINRCDSETQSAHCAETLEHIYQKMGVESRTGAAAKAYELASMANKQTGMFFLVISSLIT
jgi:hypothetical protein